MNTIHWQNLNVTDADGQHAGTLGEMVRLSPTNLDSAILNEDGSLSEATGFFLSADGEDPDWDTPRGPVDWNGFREALQAARS